MDCNTLVSVFFILSSLQIYLFLLCNMYYLFFFFVLIELNLNGYICLFHHLDLENIPKKDLG